MYENEDLLAEPDDLVLAEIEAEDSPGHMPSMKQKLRNRLGGIKYPTAPEEIELILRARQGDKIAYSRLYDQFLNLIIKIANKHRDKGLDWEDLIQEGSIGFLKAVERFNVTKGFRFTTYAWFWISQNITRAVMNTADTIRTPVHRHEDKKKIQKACKEFISKHSRKPNTQELADVTGLPVELVELLGSLNAGTDSLDEDIGSEEGMTLLSSKMGPDKLQPERLIESMADYDYLFELLNELSDDERILVMYHFGLFDGRAKNEKAILEYFGIDRREAQRRIRSIVLKLRKLGDHRRVNMQFLSNVILQGTGENLSGLIEILKLDCSMSFRQIEAVIRGPFPMKILVEKSEAAEAVAERLRAVGAKVAVTRK